MAGLLGQGWDDPRSAAVMSLAGGLLKGDFGGGLLASQQAYTGAQDAALRRGLLQAQMQETLAQAEERKIKQKQFERQLAMDQQFMGLGAPAGAPGGAAPQGAAPDTASMGAGGQPAGGFTAQQISQQYGVPIEAVIADYKFNGGKKIAELINDRSKPNWMNVNGNLVNTASPGFQGGFQPGVNVSNDGRATMWQPDGRGGLVVGAPPGAMDTYRAYQGINEGTKADFDLTTVTPAGQAPQMTTRGALVRNPALHGGSQAPGRFVSPQQQAAMDSDRRGILQQELTKAQTQLAEALRSGDQSAAARAQGDIASLQREMGGRGATVGLPLTSPEEALRGQKGVEGDAKANEARANDVKTAKKFLQIADRAEGVLKQGPTASGIGALADKTAAFFGGATDGSVSAQQLKALGGWLVANVPRMEGPQSNFDVGNYQVMAADVANETLPVERRMAALQSIKQMMQDTIKGPQTEQRPANAGPKPPTPMKGMVRGGYRFKGGDPSKQENWEPL